MELKDEEKYLGEIISKENILNLLDGIPFGKFYHEVAIILRNSLFVSSVLYSSKVWYNLTKAELNLLENVDVDVLRGILKTSKLTPKEMLFLEFSPSGR